jgi:hypothetical protein
VDNAFKKETLGYIPALITAKWPFHGALYQKICLTLNAFERKLGVVLLHNHCMMFPKRNL